MPLLGDIAILAAIVTWPVSNAGMLLLWTYSIVLSANSNACPAALSSEEGAEASGSFVALPIARLSA